MTIDNMNFIELKKLYIGMPYIEREKSNESVQSLDKSESEEEEYKQQ